MNQETKILLVDDRPENLLSLENSIEVEGVTFHTAQSAREGLALLLKNDYALVLLDVQMPEMDGFEMARLMRGTSRTANIPIIFVTAISREDQYVFEGYTQGAVDYLFKPIDTTILNSKIHVFVELYRQREIIKERNIQLERHIDALTTSKQLLREKSLALQEVNKELETFSFTVSHDLKSPIHNIGGFLNLLLDDGDKLPEDSKEMIVRVQDLLGNMNGLVDNLLSYSRSGFADIVPREFPMTFTAKEILHSVVNEDDRDRIDIKIAEDMNAVGDENLIKVVLMNLIDNSIKYARPGVPCKIELGITDVNGENAYFVRDNGRGFTEEETVRVFEPFLRLVPAAEVRGSGIGLATAKKIIERHGGRIWAEAEEGKGATFYFTLGNPMETN